MPFLDQKCHFLTQKWPKLTETQILPKIRNFRTTTWYVCNCDQGFTGVDCRTELNECDSTPCKNRGTCKDFIREFKCVCQPGFTGKYCETIINACSSYPCKNGGECENSNASPETNFSEINTSPSKFTCVCLPDFSGITCETPIKHCELLTPCSNSARCLSLPKFRYTCVCPPGFTGKNCDSEINECLSLPCRNGGICYDSENEFQCGCLPSFSGNICQKEIDFCESTGRFFWKLHEKVEKGGNWPFYPKVNLIWTKNLICLPQHEIFKKNPVSRAKTVENVKETKTTGIVNVAPGSPVKLVK